MREDCLLSLIRANSPFYRKGNFSSFTVPNGCPRNESLSYPWLAALLTLLILFLLVISVRERGLLPCHAFADDDFKKADLAILAFSCMDIPAIDPHDEGFGRLGQRFPLCRTPFDKGALLIAQLAIDSGRNLL